METTAAYAAPTVQRVTKKSSDELLRKFAELGEDEPKKRPKISKTSKEVVAYCESPNSITLVERRSLLLPQLTEKSILLRQLGSRLRARDIKNTPIFVAIEKVAVQLLLNDMGS